MQRNAKQTFISDISQECVCVQGRLSADDLGHVDVLVLYHEQGLQALLEEA